ncbi:MAG: glutaredoxin [Cyclobacteriaceae bacterium]|nr:glutaredoxin [Cyclobacteriaceae bacterium]
MQFHQNELYLLYNPQTNVGKQTKALATDICNNINEVDAVHTRLSPMYWKEIVTMLGLSPDDLLDHSHVDYKTKIANNQYTMNGWLDVLSQNAHLVKAPIAIYHGKAALCQTPTDIMKLGGAVSQGDKVLPHLKKYH